jgi:hypothetical protein
MRYHDNHILCLEYAELVPDIAPSGTYDSLKNRGNITVYGRASFENGVLIDYESLPEKYKAKVKEKYGDPYVYITKQPLVDWVNANRDFDANRYFDNYELPNGCRLLMAPAM